MSEHQAQLQIEEWQARYVVKQEAFPYGAWLQVVTDFAAGGKAYMVETRVRIDLRLIDLVRQMQEKLAEASPATIDKSPARE